MVKTLPEEVKTAFRKKGILADEALLFLKTDMGREEMYCDVYTLVTEEGIAALFCLDVLKEKKGASLFSPQKSEPALRELDYLYIPLEEIKEPHGRLGDLDELRDRVETSRVRNVHEDYKIRRNHDAEHKHFLHMIANTPDALPAEGSD